MLWYELTLWLWISWAVAGLSTRWYQTMLPVWSCPRSPHRCFPQSPRAKSRGKRNRPNETGWPFKTNYSCWLALAAQPKVTYPKVEAVERGVEIVPRSEAVHLHGHLGQKQTQEHKLCCVCFHKPGGVSCSSFKDQQTSSKFPTYRGTLSATQAGHSGRWPRTGYWGPPDTEPSSRSSGLSPCGG